MALNKPKGDMLDAGSNATPQPLGTATAGTAAPYAREDHVHAMPTAAQVGAATTTQLQEYATTAQLASYTPTSRTLTAGTGLSGGGNLSADRTLSVSFGTTSGTAAQGNDSRLSDSRTPTAHAASHATGGSDALTPANIGAIASTEKGAASGVASLDSQSHLNAVQMPAITGDVAIDAGTTTSAVNKIKGKSVATPTVAGAVAQYDGTDIVWGSIPAGGSGGGGVTMFLNFGTTADTPVTGLPSLINGVQYKELRKVAEVPQTTYTSPTLTSSYQNVVGFVTDVNDPKTTEITAGLWDFNVWASSNDATTTMRASLYKYDGGTGSSSLLATSAAVTVGTVTTQYLFSLVIPQTSILETDRICVVIEAANSGNNHTLTMSFGDSTPSHVHTTMASVGGSGVVKVIAGVVQDLASKIVDTDIDPNAAIASSKLATVQIAQGGTGSTSATAALAALGGVPITDLVLTATANKVPKLTSAGLISTAQIPALTTAQIAQITPSAIGAVATSDLTQLAVAGKVPQLTSAGTISTAQIGTLTTSQISGLAASATTDATNASNITSGTLSSDRIQAPDVQIFQTVGTTTWTKPAGAVRVRVQGWGAGGGGGSGRRGPTGEIRYGGGSGASGAYFDQMVLASAFGATETVVIGDGGTGGAARTTDGTDGQAGGTGGLTSFGALSFFGGGGGGAGNNNPSSVTTPVAAGTSPWGGNIGVGYSSTSTAASNGIPSGTTSTSTGGGSGSGAAGGMLSAAAANGINGGTGGRYLISNLVGGVAGATTTTINGGDGNSTGVNSNGLPMGASGGGGGCSTITGTAGNGGAGGFPGAGGGGGGASQNGVNSGAGGKGGKGLVVITTYFA